MVKGVPTHIRLLQYAHRKFLNQRDMSVRNGFPIFEIKFQTALKLPEILASMFHEAGSSNAYLIGWNKCGSRLLNDRWISLNRLDPSVFVYVSNYSVWDISIQIYANILVINTPPSGQVKHDAVDIWTYIALIWLQNSHESSIFIIRKD